MTDSRLLEPFMTAERARRLEEVLARRTSSIAVVMENLHKDHNLSAILRTCEAFGVQRVHVVPQPGQGKVLRLVTRGCHHWLTIVRHDTVASCLARLRGEGFRVLAASLGARALPMEEVDWSGSVALLFSNELQGAGAEVETAVDGLFTIPLVGFSQSLNVSVAAGIALHHVRRWKEARPGEMAPLAEEESGALLSAWSRRAIRNSGAILGEMRRRGEG